MKLVFLTHPAFLRLRSQAHFARMLSQACRARGHEVELRQPQDTVHRLFAGTPLVKWAGYLDQYLLFPMRLRRLAAQDAPDTLYVFCDQALGPWVPALVRRPHVVHCHDLLALRSALGELPENPTRLTGRLYQRYIRRGFARARHFISISSHTRDDLHRVGLGRRSRPVTSEVIFNGLNHDYRPLPETEARALLTQAEIELPEAGFLLHVGGGQWYKNTAGVVALYARLVARLQSQSQPVPALLMVSPPASGAVLDWLWQVPAGGRVRFVQGLEPQTLQATYSLARALLFPSLAEGFGWPVAEALACACPVVTTDAAPMNEVGGAAALYLPRLQAAAALPEWAEAAAAQVEQLLAEPPALAAARRQRALAHAAQFAADFAIDAYLRLYTGVLQHELGGDAAPAIPTRSNKPA
jgi:glycosyltransferase involved in cell wall biosynthesis